MRISGLGGLRSSLKWVMQWRLVSRAFVISTIVRGAPYALVTRKGDCLGLASETGGSLVYGAIPQSDSAEP